MTNVKQEVRDGKLILTIDLSQDHGPSKSGKTNVVGTTGGFQKIAGHEGFSFGLNVVKKGVK